MSTQVEKLENNMIKLTIEVSAEKFEEGINDAFKKNKNKIQVPGFRKGRVPRKLIEATYGADMFYEEAANYCIPEAYETAIDEIEEVVVSRPNIDVIQIESGKTFIFTAEVAIKPEVTLGDYKGLEIEKAEAKVEDADVNAEIDKVREQNSREISVTDRAIEDGDIVNIDFEGSVDGEVFQGGTAQGHDLVIGSKSFIDNFEEQLVGKNINEELEVSVTFPEEYQQKDLAGKPAIFKVKINEIKVKELPEANDDLAMDVSEFDTLEAYKNDIKENLMKTRTESVENGFKDAALDKAVENATIDIPEAMIEFEVEQMLYEMQQSLSQQGLSIEQYLGFMGQNIETFKATLKPQAVKRISQSLVLEAIGNAESIVPTDAEIETEITERAEAYQMEATELREKLGEDGLKDIRSNLISRTALDLLATEAVAVAVKEADAE